MIISDLDYIEEIAESSDIEGGRRRRRRARGGIGNLASLLQSLTIYPASSASVLNLGGNSIGNTAISFNISMPILVVGNNSGVTMLGSFGAEDLLRSLF